MFSSAVRGLLFGGGGGRGVVWSRRRVVSFMILAVAFQSPM